MGIVLAAVLGCSPDAKDPPPEASSPRPANLPPLQVAVVEADGVMAEIGLRWQSFSDQPLQIVSMTRDELQSKEASTVDVLVYPADLMGTLVARDWIASVPRQVMERAVDRSLFQAGWEDDRGASGDKDEDKQIVWPQRWRSMSMYGGKLMALPMGSPSLIAITRGLDVSPLEELHRQIAASQNSPEASEKAWTRFLDAAEASSGLSRDELNQRFAGQWTEPTPEQRRWLVSRFLWIVATTESRYRGIFDLYRIQSRLNQPEFARAATILARLARLEPQATLASPSQAWEQVVGGSARFAIGWPRTDFAQRLESQDAALSALALIPLAWNDGSGLLVSLGRRTRQSASASEFLVWLADETQRVALQPKDERVELLEIDDDRNVIRDDYRDYQTVQRLESSHVSMELTPRFADSDLFLKLIGDALAVIILDPTQAESVLVRCRDQSNALIEERGKETLRVSLEAASGYSQ
jgi:hypothetical protein